MTANNLNRFYVLKGFIILSYQCFFMCRLFKPPLREISAPHRRHVNKHNFLTCLFTHTNTQVAAFVFPVSRVRTKSLVCICLQHSDSSKQCWGVRSGERPTLNMCNLVGHVSCMREIIAVMDLVAKSEQKDSVNNIFIDENLVLKWTVKRWS